MAIPLSVATAVIQVLTPWLSFLLVLSQPKPTQGHNVPANPQGAKKLMETGLFLLSPDVLSYHILFCALLCAVRIPARKRQLLETPAQHVSSDFCLYFQSTYLSHRVYVNSLSNSTASKVTLLKIKSSISSISSALLYLF